MKTILISTIVRNRASKLNKWYNQIKNLVSLDNKNAYYLSVYENDSTDNSKEMLNNFDFSFLAGVKIQNEKIETEYFYQENLESNRKKRVENLALARNKTLFGITFLSECSHVLCIEPDIVYDPQSIINNIINSDFDIVSPISRQDGFILYDGWATRKEKEDVYWNNKINLNGVLDVWSTFNCLCFYKSDPFKFGVGFGFENPRTKKYDCDTTVICENFRKFGYDKIKLNCNVIVDHLR
jgi:hypothetical protein